MTNLKTPFLLVNFKAYQEAFGEKALKLARIHYKVAKDTGVHIAIAVSPLDLRMVIEEVDLPVFAQHSDIMEYGPYTGHIVLEALKEIGVYGTILNHVEKRMDLEKLEQTIAEAKEIGLRTFVCTHKPSALAVINLWNPDFIAVEPVELIGTNLSVVNAKPEFITDSLKYLKKPNLLVGGNIRNSEHVRKALALGANGILVSSAVVKAPDPEKVLRDLASEIAQREILGR